jgi:2-phospho-L-lactate guanylyltransferase
VSGWTVIIPVKPWALSKSGLDVDELSREALARAFAQDVFEAVGGSAEVGATIVVSAERELRSWTSPHPTFFVEDHPLRTSDGLNQAVASGARWARIKRPGDGLAVLPADLPALTSAALDRVLSEAAGHALSYVADRSCLGTTMIMSAEAGGLRTAYGPGSARRHRDIGAVELTGAEREARHDVDTLADLDSAGVLALGRHTAEAIAAVRARRSGRRATTTARRR